jgi:hypothetical protein
MNKQMLTVIYMLGASSLDFFLTSLQQEFFFFQYWGLNSGPIP